MVVHLRLKNFLPLRRPFAVILPVMNCIVTAGPTFEPLDQVRRLTNFSTGRLGIELANFLTQHGHAVTLLVAEHAAYPGKRDAIKTLTFTTTDDLRAQLQAMAASSVEAVFHAAAVSDFRFGKMWVRPADGEPQEIKAGKISTRQGTLLAELLPTVKIIPSLRAWFPKARIVGWKYEVDGDRSSVIAAAQQQLRECLTDACVANGPAYGEGFGLITRDAYGSLAGAVELFAALEKFIPG
jgi:phosphopantothenoylcysteine synthetase/decarboxylase